MRQCLARLAARVTHVLSALARDEQGAVAVEYLLVLTAFVVPMAILLVGLQRLLADYYSMIAFYVGWPFL